MSERSGAAPGEDGEAFAAELPALEAALDQAAERLRRALDDLEEATDWMLAAQADGRVEEALSGATPYLRLAGLAYGGVLLAKGALKSGMENRALRTQRTIMARSYAMTLLCDTASLKEDIVGSSDSILEFDPEAMTS